MFRYPKMNSQNNSKLHLHIFSPAETPYVQKESKGDLQPTGRYDLAGNFLFLYVASGV